MAHDAVHADMHAAPAAPAAAPYEAVPPAQEPPEYAQRAGSLLSEEEERDRLAVR